MIRSVGNPLVWEVGLGVDMFQRNKSVRFPKQTHQLVSRFAFQCRV